MKSLAGADWWQKTLALVAAIVREVPCYVMEFDKSGKVADQLEALAQAGGAEEKAQER
jgi:hypothetical protein